MRNVPLSCLCLAALAAGAGAGPALAAAPYDADTAAEAHALAEAGLQTENARLGFENATDSTTPTLRHRQSGATCRFWAESVYVELPVMAFGYPIAPGSKAYCYTVAQRTRDHRWSISTTIEAAAQALDGDRFRQFDGENTPQLVSPAYLARRTAFWEHGRRGPVQHRPALRLDIGNGENATVHRVYFHTGVSVEHVWTALVRGWAVTMRVQSPEASLADSEALMLAQMSGMLPTITQAHPDAGQVAAVLALDADDGDESASDSTAERVHAAFRDACLAPALAGQSFDGAIEGREGWTRIATRSDLPNIRQDPGQTVWNVPGLGGEVLVLRSAAMAGDCAVAAYGVDLDLALRLLNRRLTQGEDAPFGLGFNRPLDGGRIMQEYDGAAWSGGGVLILGSAPDASRPDLFLGLGPPLEAAR